MAVTLLTDKALTWWRAVSTEAWATLGVCDWTVFTAKIELEFRDLNHTLRK